MPSVSSSPSPSPSPSSASKTPTSPAVPISIAVIAVVFLAFAMLLTFHFRRQNQKKRTAAQARKGREVRAGETVSRAHPAALMITPEDGKGTPRFVHTPGTNMRIATRRADGAWEFEDPRAPFTPAIIADASETASRISSVPSLAASDSSSEPRDPLRSRALNSPYSQTSYETPTPGSSSQLLPPPTTTTVATPWGPPTTPRTADSDISGRSPWRSLHSPAPSTSASPFLPAPPTAASSRRSSIVSSNDSFLDLEPSGASTYSNPFRSPASTAPSRGARWPASPAVSVRASPEPPTTPAARARNLTRDPWQDAAQSSALAEQSGAARTGSVSPEPPMTPAARAKEAESAAARAIRRGYERVDRMSEYADEDLPSY